MPLRDLVTRDLGWKLLSVALALAIWLTVHTISEDSSPHSTSLDGQMIESFMAVPVLVVSAAADVREFKVRPATVQVTLSGKPELVAKLDAKQIRVLVDLTGIDEARGLKKRVEVSTPPGFT